MSAMPVRAIKTPELLRKKKKGSEPFPDGLDEADSLSENLGIHI